MLTKISPWVIRKPRTPGYLKLDLNPTVVTGYDSLVDDEPELARAMVILARIPLLPQPFVSNTGGLT